jgi:hypothetical protein
MSHQYPVRTGPIQNNAAPITTEVASSPGAKPRLFTTSAIVSCFVVAATVVHVAAAFSPEMAQGHPGARPRPALIQRAAIVPGGTLTPIEIIQPPEMVGLDRLRRIAPQYVPPLSPIDVTVVPPPFQGEALHGHIGNRPPPRVRQHRAPVNVIGVASVLSPEMVLPSPDRHPLARPQHLPPIVPIDVAQAPPPFQGEALWSLTPTQSALRHDVRRQPRPVNVIGVGAVFFSEMVAPTVDRGARLAKPRQQAAPAPPEVRPFEAEALYLIYPARPSFLIRTRTQATPVNVIGVARRRWSRRPWWRVES